VSMDLLVVGGANCDAQSAAVPRNATTREGAP